MFLWAYLRLRWCQGGKLGKSGGETIQSRAELLREKYGEAMWDGLVDLEMKVAEILSEW
jgi:hypothetical protein